MIDQLLKLNDQLAGAPAGVLVAIFAVCLGYLLKTIPVVDNRYIPLFVVCFGTAAFMVIAPPRHPDMDLRVYVGRNFLEGVITGFLAWMLHAKILRRFVDPKLFNDDGSTKFFTKDGGSPPAAPLVAALLALGLSVASAQTNSPFDSPIPIGPSLTNLIGSGGANLSRVGTDAVDVFRTFSLTNPLAVGIVALKVPGGYGGGIEVHSKNPNTIAQVGFGVFGWQEVNPTTHKKDIAFADATINFSITTQEKVPVLGWPFYTVIESGPAFKFSGVGGGTLLEQSAALAEMNFAVGKRGILTAGGGVIHCSDPLFVNRAIPSANLSYSFHSPKF